MVSAIENDLLRDVAVVPFDELSVKEFGRLRGTLAKQGGTSLKEVELSIRLRSIFSTCEALELRFSSVYRCATGLFGSHDLADVFGLIATLAASLHFPSLDSRCTAAAQVCLT